VNKEGEKDDSLKTVSRKKEKKQEERRLKI
jgi:hypothetical protein